MSDDGDPPIMWLMDSESFMDALERVAAGETPDIVFTECFANAFIGSLSGDDG